MIAVDWGTTHLRAYRLSASGEIEARLWDPRGIMSIPAGEFAGVLDDVLSEWEAHDHPIIMSGMIGSRQGWLEVPYVACPAKLRDLADGVRSAPWSGRRTVLISPGLTCRDCDGVPDVMRGEEVQIFGALSVSTKKRATICLPGTHSKHAVVHGNTIEGFVTHMTGEVFAVLRDHSILGRLMTERRNDLDAFDEGLRRARQQSGLLHHVFGVRTRILTSEMDAAALIDYLSGILIGHELFSSPMRPPIVVVGEPNLCSLYHRALAQQGLDAERVSADLATTRGLHALAKLVGKDGQ
jgi:2-dehydro-3-deoxygalactonokinase